MLRKRTTSKKFRLFMKFQLAALVVMLVWFAFFMGIIADVISSKNGWFLYILIGIYLVLVLISVAVLYFMDDKKE
jgi:hypothetical protein